jgi:hypothetical protein
MDLVEYQRLVAAIGFGKRLPTALYVFRDSEAGGLGTDLDHMVAQMVVAFQIGPEFNVIKLRSDELKVSFLCYPRFFEDPHPALRHAITLDLVRGRARHTDYEGNPNPPILHRKEAFLPLEHPKRTVFVALTEAEEAEGLYANTSTIGFKLNWERLLQAKGLSYKGHRLVREGRGKAESRKQKAEIGWPQEGARSSEEQRALAGTEAGNATPHPALSPAEAERVEGNEAAGMRVPLPISPHLFRHATAMHMLEAGVTPEVIALWLGHENLNTTHQYVEADLAMKKRALETVRAPKTKPRNFRPDDKLLRFLDNL